MLLTVALVLPVFWTATVKVGLPAVELIAGIIIDDWVVAVFTPVIVPPMYPMTQM
jgi:hypothetical protein